MRGTPFGFKAWHLGLNTIDSPFTLVEGETRDCLNVVSTERGAIKKRNGSLLFAPGLSGAAFGPSIVDSFKRAEESPLSNGGKWILLSGGGATTTGKIGPGEHWQGHELAGAYWNEEFSNPQTSVEVVALATTFGIFLWSCIPAAKNSGYRFGWEKGPPTPETFQLTRVKEGVVTGLAEVKGTLEPKDQLAILVTGGVVSGWRKRAGTWVKILEAKDTNFTKGFTGFEVNNVPEEARLNNFGTGELSVATGLEFSGIAPVKTAAGSFLIASSGKELFSISKEGEGLKIGEGFSEGKQWSVVQFNKAKAKAGGPVYLQNGTDTPQTWTGAEGKTKVEEWKAEAGAFEGKEMEATVPKAKYMTVGLERVFLANTAQSTSAVQFSELKPGTHGEEPDPSLWPKENIIYFDPEDGQEITGIGTIGPYILVFKPYKTWIIHTVGTGGAKSLIRKLSDNTGCVSHRSITETPLGTFFLTADQGIYLTNGSKLTEMSYKVRPTILKMNGAQREKAAGAFFNNHYYLSFPFEGSSTPNRTLDYDVALKSWWFHDIAGNQWAEWEPSTGEPFLFTAPAKAKGGVVKAFIEGIYTDSGTKYTGAKGFGAYWISPWEPFFYFIFRHRIAAPFIKKRIRQFFWNGTGTMEAFQYRSFNSGYDIIPAVVNNKNMMHPETPVHLTPEVEEGWGEGEERWGMTQNQWAGIQSAARARAYSLGTATEWSFGFGNNSSEFFEITFAAYMAQFRKS